MVLKGLFKKSFISVGCIVLITILSYHKILQGNYINWDDHVYVERVPHEELGPELVFSFFTNGFNRTYVPLTMLSWAVEIKLFGRSPAIHLLINLLLHLSSVVIIFLIGKQLNLGQRSSLLISAVFALHPVHVESVAWITERKDVLYGFFFLCALLFYIKDRVSKLSENRYYYLSILFFLLALFSKGQAVTLALVLPAIDYFLGKFTLKPAYILRLLPFYMLALAFGMIAMYVQEFFDPERYTVYTFSGLQRLAISGVALIHYLRITVFPLILNPINSLPSVFSPFPVMYYAGIVSFVLYAILLWKSRKRNKLIFTGLWIYIACIVLMLDHTQIGIVLFADRFLYISVLGYGIVLAGILKFLKTRINEKVLTLGALFFLSALAAKTYQQSRFWNNSFSLFGYAMKLDPESAVAIGGYGMSLYTKGEYDEAIPYLERSLELHPDQNRVALVAAKSFDITNQPEKAIKYFRKALVTGPKMFAEKEYVRLIENYLAVGDPAEALRTANQLLNLFPEAPQGYLVRGKIMAQHYNQLDKGAEDLLTALELDPGNYVAVNGLGIIELIRGEPERAEQLFLRSLELNPNNCDALINLLALYNQLEAFDRIEAYQLQYQQLECK